MHIHTLHARTHASFLESQRHDPITGDAFKAGDEVVFCASCRSAFLRESWDYMGQAHCGQRETLANFPEAKTLNLKDGPEVEDRLFLAGAEVEGMLISAQKKVGKKMLLRRAVLGNPILLAAIGLYLFRVLVLWDISALWSGSLFNVVLLLVIFLSGVFTASNYIYNKTAFFALGENYLHFFNKKIHYSRIKSLHISFLDGSSVQFMTEAENTVAVRVIIQEAKSKRPRQVRFYRALGSRERIALLYDLLSVSQTTEVNVYSDSARERELIEKLSREYEGNFHLWEDGHKANPDVILPPPQ